MNQRIKHIPQPYPKVYALASRIYPITQTLSPSKDQKMLHYAIASF